MDLTLVGIFKDGFIYNVNPLEFNVKGTNVGGTWSISVGSGDQWKPGVDHVMTYDRAGTKVAHISRGADPASTCSRPNFRVHVPVAGTEQCGRPPSHQDEIGRKAATEKLHQYTSTKGEPEGPTDEAPP